MIEYYVNILKILFLFKNIIKLIKMSPSEIVLELLKITVENTQKLLDSGMRIE